MPRTYSKTFFEIEKAEAFAEYIREQGGEDIIIEFAGRNYYLVKWNLGGEEE